MSEEHTTDKENSAEKVECCKPSCEPESCECKDGTSEKTCGTSEKTCGTCHKSALCNLISRVCDTVKGLFGGKKSGSCSGCTKDEPPVEDKASKAADATDDEKPSS